MYGTRLYHKEVSFVGRLLMQKLHYAAVGAGLVQLGCIQLLLEADANSGIGTGFGHIPQFLFAKGVVALRCKLVRRADGKRAEAVLHVKGSDGERELAAVEIVIVVADHTLEVSFHDVIQIVTGQVAAANLGLFVAKVCYNMCEDAPREFNLPGDYLHWI